MWKPQQPPLHSTSTHSLVAKHTDTYWGLHCISKKSSKQSCVIWKFTGLSCFKQRWLMKVRSQFLERLSLFTNKGKDKNFHKGPQKGDKCTGDITTHSNLPQKSWRLIQICTATKCNRATFSWGKSIFTRGHFKIHIFWGSPAINIFYDVQIQKMKFLSQRTKKPCSVLVVIYYLKGNASIAVWDDSASGMRNIN